MKQDFDDIMKDYPESLWCLNAYAYSACLAKDEMTTQRILEKIGNSPHYEIWKSKAPYDVCWAL